MNISETTGPAVTVLIPAYRPATHLIDTIVSTGLQNRPDIRVHVSLDHAPDHTPPNLAGISGADIRVFDQPRRLGWVGNTNALMQTVETPFFIVLGHDDKLSPNYIDYAVAALTSTPTAVVAHGDLHFHGVVRDGEIATTPRITGDRMSRMMEFISRGPNRAEISDRGVVRSEVLKSGIHFRSKRSDGQFSNTLWALELLIHGETITVPNIYYDKYIEADGLSRVYNHRNADEKSVMLADNMACLVEALAAAGLAPDEQDQITTTWIEWLLGLQGNWNTLADERRSDKRPYGELRPAIARLCARALVSLALPSDSGET